MALRPAAFAYDVASRLRQQAFAAGWGAPHSLPLPAVGIGSLQVGGAGKTPLAAWAAAWYLARGVRPGILLRGYGGDEGLVHRELVPDALVVENPDRFHGARTALAGGAEVAVLDDNAQHLRAIPDRQVLLLGVEALMGPAWLLPAGPWRERWDSGRADLLVLTRKSASPRDADQAHARVRRAYPRVPIARAHLAVAGWRPLAGGPPVSDAALATKALFALCGIADPRPFAAHARQVGHVRARRFLGDHARYHPSRVHRIARAAELAGVDYVVTTAKDAVKLRSVWPADAPPVLVADLAISWDAGEDLVTSTLEACLPGVPAQSRFTHAAAGTAAGMA
jgi:tetraacyldisaccharide 4'-kinase